MRVLLGFEVLSVGWKWGEVPDERGGDAPPCQRLLVGNRCVEAGPVSLSVWQPAHCFKASADQGIPRAARRCRPPCRCLYVTHEPSHWERITRAHGSASCSLRLPQRPPPPITRPRAAPLPALVPAGRQGHCPQSPCPPPCRASLRVSLGLGLGCGNLPQGSYRIKGRNTNTEAICTP